VSDARGSRVADVVDQGQLGKLVWSRELKRPDRSWPKAKILHVFDQGCVLGDDADGVKESFRWAEVAEFTKKIVGEHVGYKYHVSYKVVSTDYNFTFKLADRTVLLSGRSDKRLESVFEGFSDLVSPLVCAAQLPGMQAALQRGETLEFGTLKVDSTGLTRPAWRKKNQHAAWGEVTSFNVFEGDLNIHTRGEGLGTWHFTRASDVPNIDALFEVLTTFVAGGQANP
jgi:hypothetical protein